MTPASGFAFPKFIIQFEFAPSLILFSTPRQHRRAKPWDHRRRPGPPIIESSSLPKRFVSFPDRIAFLPCTAPPRQPTPSPTTRLSTGFATTHCRTDTRRCPVTMSNFLGGSAVECGPSNALKDVGALVERDYGAQRVSTSHAYAAAGPGPGTACDKSPVPASRTPEMHTAASDL